MGGCVVSLMDNKHRNSLQPSLNIQNYRAYGPDSVPVPSIGTSSSSNIYRNGRYHSDAELISWREKTYGGPNQTQRFAKSCEERAETPMVAYRQLEKVVKEDVPMPNGGTKRMEISYMGERHSLTGAQLWQYTTDFSRGLGELGLPPRSHVAIYEETRWEWLPTIYGVWLQDAVATTVYANLGEEALFYALNETQCSAIVCNGRSIPNLLRGVASGAFKACTIIYFGTLSAEGSAAVSDCPLIAWQDVISLGSKARDTRPVTLPTNNDSTALIMYTSGTTGDPKGVVHSHGSITAGVLIMDEWLISLLGEFLPHETYCSYLPLAHIMEFGVVSIFLGRGALVGFGNPRTLTDATARPHGDVNEYHPTCLIGVPRIFDTIRRAIEAKLPPVGTLRRRIFDYAYQSRLAALQNGQETPYWNEKVFKPARAALGGRVRLMLSGGGPLSQVTQEFVGVVLGDLVLGWGLTETVCCGAIMRSGDMDLGTVGQVLVAEELKLLDTVDYKHTDSPEPRGELCLRGPFMFKGYYKHPELTKEVLGDDGWFRTGDIGSIDSKGRVRIIGRIKALAKNCLGEYIALEVLESIYNNHPLVLNNCSCVLTHPDRNYIALIAVTDEAKATAFARTHDIEDPFPAVLKNKEFRRRAAESMAEFATAAKRQRFECVKTVCLVNDEWSPENNLLTAAMKLKRQAINAKYANDLNELFASE